MMMVKKILMAMVLCLPCTAAEAQLGNILKSVGKAILNDKTKNSKPVLGNTSTYIEDDDFSNPENENFQRSLNDSKRATYKELLAKGVPVESIAHLIEGMDSIGIYADSAGVLVQMEPTDFDGNGVKNGSAAIIKSKLQAYVKGVTGKYQFPECQARMRLYFSDKKENRSEKHMMFTYRYSIEDIMIGALEVRKGKKDRVLYIGYASEIGLAKNNQGATQAEGVTMQVKDLGGGRYDILVEGPAGEYCLIAQKKGEFPFERLYDFSLGK